MTRAIAVAAVSVLMCATSIDGQEVPRPVREALDARETPFCWDSESVVTQESTPFFPGLTVFVSRCTMYFGLPASAVVGVDTSGFVYLLDSPANVRLIEGRFGRPALDSTNVIDYVLAAAKLEGAIEWDAAAIVDSVHPDPRSLAPLYPTSGDCAATRKPFWVGREGVWQVYFDVATETSIDRISGLVSNGLTSVLVENVCSAMHGN